MSALKLLFRVDDGPGIGAGHLMRCLALAEAVHEQGGVIALSTVRESKLHADWVGLDAQIYVQQREVGSTDDLTLTSRIIREFNADWLVVDGYGFDTGWLDAISAKHPVLCLDDLGNRDAAVRLMLNQNPGAEKRYGSAYSRCSRALLGLNWFLLRREWLGVQHAPEPRRMLLTLGGEDPDNRIVGLMQALLKDGRGFVADVVSSASEAGFQQALFMAHDRPDCFTVHRGPVALPLLMRSAAVVVTGGGVTPIEAVSLGVVPVILILADNQKSGAEYLAAAGVARSLEIGDCAMIEAARSALDLLSNDVDRSTMVARGRAMVDGIGPMRLVEALFKEME